MSLSPRALTLSISLAFAALAVACSNPCDALVDKRCECGPDVCRVARDELKLSTELLRTLVGPGARHSLADRCKAQLAAFSCPKN